MPQSRIFVEVNAKNNLSPEVNKMLESLNELGYKSNAASKSLLTALDNIRNPARETQKEIEILTKLGASQAEIFKLLGDRAKGTGVDIGDLGSKLADFARNPLEAAKEGLAGMLEKLGPGGIALGAFGAAAGTAGIALGKMFYNMSQEMEQLQNLSAITGRSTQDLEAYARITKEAGLEGMDLGRVLGRIQEQLGDEKANDFTKGMARLGVATKDSAGNARDAIDVLDDLRQTLLTIEDPTKRSQEAMSALGIRYREVAALLVNMPDSFRNMRKAMQDAGITTDQFTKNELMALDAELDVLTRKLEGFWKQVKIGSMRGLIGSPIGLIMGLQGEEAAPEGKTDAYFQAQIARRIAGWEAEYEKTWKAGEKAREAQEKYNDAIAEYNARTETAIYQAEAWRKIIEATAKLPRAGTAQAVFGTIPSAQLFTEELMGMTANEAQWNAYIAKLAPLGAMKGVGDVDTFGRKSIMEAMMVPDKKAQDRISQIWQRQVSTIVTDLSNALVNATSVVDAMKSLGKSMLRALIETLLSPLQEALAGLLSGLFGGRGGLSGAGISFGGIWGGIKGIFGGGRSPVAATSPMWAGSTLSTGLGLTASGAGAAASTGGWQITGLGSAGTSAAVGGAVVGGTMLMSDAWKRGSAAEGVGGGALTGGGIGFMLGGPIGAAIGAAIGALAGGIIGALGGGERARQRELERRASIQSGFLVNTGVSTSHSGAFGMEGDYSVESDLMGRSIGRRNVTIIVNNSMLDGSQADAAGNRIAERIGAKLMTGGSALYDNINWATA